MKRLLLLSFLVSSSQMFSQTTFSWRSEATNANWSTVGNWWNGASSGWGFGIQNWDNNHETTQNNDVSSASTHSLVFSAGCTSDRVMNGNSLRLYDFGGTDPRITNNSTASITFNIALEGDGDGGDPLKFQIDSTGNLVFAGNVNNQGSWIDIEGSGGGSVTINGDISGSGGLYKTGSTTLNLSGNNTYTDNTTINAGTVNVNAGGTLGSGSDITVETGAILNINESITVASLTIVGTGAVNIAEGKSLTITGNLSNAGTITLNASSSGYAQLKVDGSVSGSGDVTVEQHVAHEGWHNMAMPVAGNLSEFGTVNTAVDPNTVNIYTWNEAASSWNNAAPGSDGSAVAASAGTAYMVYVGTNGVANTGSEISFTGSLITSAIPNLTNSGSGDDKGWNFVPNPFSCDLNYFDISKTDLSNGVSVWNQNTDMYLTISGVAEDTVGIAVGQGFWVEANGTSPSLGTLTMASNCRVNSLAAFFKTQSNNINIPDRFYLNAYPAANHSLKDRLLYAMIPGATDGRDNQWDMGKRLNGTTSPTLMSVDFVSGEELAVNAFDYSPNNIKTKKLPLRFVSGLDGEVYFIELDDALLSNNYHIELEDLKLRRKHNLKSAPYKFVHDQNAEYRFVLHISPVTTINQGHTHTPIVNGGVNVGINGGTLVLKMDAPQQDVQGALLDLNGRRVMEVEYPAGASQYELNVNGLAKGIYLLQLQSAQGEEVLKVMIP